MSSRIRNERDVDRAGGSDEQCGVPKVSGTPRHVNGENAVHARRMRRFPEGKGKSHDACRRHTHGRARGRRGRVRCVAAWLHLQAGAIHLALATAIVSLRRGPCTEGQQRRRQEAHDEEEHDTNHAQANRKRRACLKSADLPDFSAIGRAGAGFPAQRLAGGVARRRESGSPSGPGGRRPQATRCARISRG